MDDVLSKLWEDFKTHRIGALILFLIVLLGVLGFVALVSDVGFSEEVKTFRYWILFAALGIAVIYVVVWGVLLIGKETRQLKAQVESLQNDLAQERSSREQAVTELGQKEEEITHLRQTILELIKEITTGRIFEVTKVQFYKDKLFLTLNKGTGIDLKEGDEIRIIDKVEGYVMGVFEVTEVRAAEYIARSGNFISPIWMGYVRQPGNAESSALPDTVAIYYPKDGKTYE